jgi:hypothetical protein
MNSVPRKLTVGLLVAIGAAACGDDVTVKEQPAPTPVVRSVVVSPSSATIAPGGSFTFGAAVDADAGIARTVTWSSSNSAITVTNEGVASAPSTLTAGGVSSICATSTADAAVKGCAQLTVTPVVAPTPASVSIQSVTVGCDAINGNLAGVGPCGTLWPVATNNVTGQIDVTLNVTRPQGSTAAGVEVAVVNAAGAVEGTAFVQAFASASSGDELALQTAGQDVIVSIQTAEYTLNASNAAVVTYPNGNKTIRARLCSAVTGGVCTAQTGGTASSAQRQVRFANPNGYHISWSNPTGNNANGVAVRQTSAGGFSWIGGTGFTVTATPVAYDGVTLSSAAGAVALNFGGNGCNIGAGSDLRSLAAAAPVSGVYSAVFTYANTTAASSANATPATTNLNGYEMNPACAPAGVIPFASGGVNTQGNSFVTQPIFGPFGANNTLNVPGGPFVFPAAGPSGANTFAPVIRLDNQGPNSGAFTIINNPNSRSSGWMNDAVVLNGANTGATSDGTVTATPADDGFGGTVTRIAHPGTAAACTSASTCITLAAATSVAGFAETLTPTANNFIVEATDPFGNRAISNGPLNFGVDRTAPAGTAVVGTPTDAAVMDAAAGSIQINFTDALSGFAAASAVSHSFIRVNGSTGGLARTNVIGSSTISATPFATAGTAAAPTATFVNTPAVLSSPAGYTYSPTSITTAAVAVPVNAGYYIYQARSRDEAGNSSAMFVRRLYVNNSGVPLVTGLNSSLSFTGGAAASFPGAAGDSTEVTSGELRLTYPNLGGLSNLVYSRPTPLVDPTFDDNMPIPASVPFGVSAFIRGVQRVTASPGDAPDGSTFATVKPTAATGRVYNPFGHSVALLSGANAPGASGISTDFTAPILGVQVTGNTDFSTVAAPSLIARWFTSTSATTPAATCAAAVSGLRTCTFTVTVRGPTGTFTNPFPGGIAVAESKDAGGPDGDYRLISGPGAVSLGAVSTATNPSGVNVTVTANSALPAPFLDNGTNRDFQWTVTVTRVSAAVSGVPTTLIYHYRVIGLNAGFDGLATNPLQINFANGAITP